MEHLNETLFLWINATDPSAASLQLSSALANWLVYLFPFYLVLNWFKSDPDGREALLQAALTAVIGLFLGWLIARLWFHPRPFVLALGHLYIPHRANASFPSNHLTFIWSICAGLWVHGARRRAALVLGALGLPVAWARIYLGLHFPLDMVGALLTAIVAAWLCLPLRTRLVPALRRWIEPPYRWLFAWAIRRGWVRA